MKTVENSLRAPTGLRSCCSWRYGAGLLLLAICLAIVTGCGFKLRGSLVDAHHLPPMYVHSERGSRLYAELYTVFEQAGVVLVEQRDQAGWVLMLSDEQRERRVLSVRSSGKVQEYELQYGVYYSLHTQDGNILIDRQLLTLLRDFSFSGTDVLSKADEEELLYQGMQQQAVQMILRRLLSQGRTLNKEKAEAAAVP